MPPLQLHARHAETAPSATQHIDDDEAKMTRQAALSKAMGTLFLQHRVASLEADVDGLAFQRSNHTATSSFHRRPAQPHAASKAPARRERPINATAGPSREAQRPKLACKETYVVDASVLIYSLRSVHEWLKRGDVCVIVPQEVITTLDVLKKGEHALNLAARKATRFLEEKLASPGATREHGGLVPQRDGERCTIQEAEGLREACAATRQLLIEADEKGAKMLDDEATTKPALSAPASATAARTSHESDRSNTSSTSSTPPFEPHLAPTLRLLPHATRELLLCALHFPHAVLAIAHAPPHLSTLDVQAASSASDLTVHARTTPRYLERVDGAYVQRLAGVYGVRVEKRKTADSWIELGRVREGGKKEERKRSGEERRRG